jgi:hypothetical protein
MGRVRVLGITVVCTWLLYVPLAHAQYTSPNYKVEESQFGTGGDPNATSPSYQSQQSVGSLGIGTFSSANYDSNIGFLTQNTIFLEMIVSGATVDLGVLSDSSTSSGSAQAGACNCSFTVRTYLSDAYVVYTMSQPPTNESGRALTAKTVLGIPSSNLNVEEFGMNLVANTSPSTMCANPVNQPDNTFADGQAATGYSTTNQYKYNPGDIIASAAASPTNPAIGQTDYTISYIAKRNLITSAGVFIMNHDIVATATF